MFAGETQTVPKGNAKEETAKEGTWRSVAKSIKERFMESTMESKSNKLARDWNSGMKATSC